MTNEEIVRLIQQGEESEELYGILIENNKGLFRHIHKKLDPYSMIEEEDVFSICYGCVFKTVKRWDGARGIQFTTLLHTVIVRELNRIVKREFNRRSIQDRSLDFRIQVGEGEASEVIDFLVFAKPQKEFENSSSDIEIIKKVAVRHLKTLPLQQRRIAHDYFLKGKGQVELSKQYNMSQSAISRTLTKIKNSAKQELKRNGIDSATILSNLQRCYYTG